MPNVQVVSTGIELDAESAVDFFLVQWHTPLPHNFEHIEDSIAAAKSSFLEQFASALSKWIQGNDDRPVFIAFPEISLPQSCMSKIIKLMASIPNPMVIVAGLEHLSWTEYENLLSECHDSTPREECHDTSRATQRMNGACIWIRAKGSSPDLYFQSKLWPAPDEEPHVHKGKHVLMFQSSSRLPGEHIDFAVQICSDFCSTQHVDDLRLHLAEAASGTSVDLVFLLQCNHDQEADQFTSTFDDFFRPRPKHLSTDRSCIVCVNNAAKEHGHLKPKNFGDSRWLFPRCKWRLTRNHQTAPNTFWLREYPNHIAAIVREPGSGIYLFTYRPVEMVDSEPGTGQERPFMQDVCCASISQDTSGMTLGEPTPLSAASVWLSQQWITGQTWEQLSIKKIANGRSGWKSDVGLCSQVYATCRSSWVEHVHQHTNLAHEWIMAYFCAWHDSQDYPGKQPELRLCNTSTGEGAQRLLQIYTLMALSVNATEITPSVDRRFHCHLTKDPAPACIFLWGGGKKRPYELIQAVRKWLPDVTVRTKQYCIIAINADGQTDQDQLADVLRHQGNTTSANRPNLPPHLRQGGRTTRIGTSRGFMLLYHGEIHDCLDQASSLRNYKDVMGSLIRKQHERVQGY